MTEILDLAFDFQFEDLYLRDGLARIERCFTNFLKEPRMAGGL